MTRSRNPLGVWNGLLNYGMIEWQKIVEDYHKTPEMTLESMLKAFDSHTIT
jgi:hypothetical protein